MECVLNCIHTEFLQKTLADINELPVYFTFCFYIHCGLILYNIQAEAVAVDADGSDTEQQEVADTDSLPDPNNEADSMDTEPQDKDEDNEADMDKDMNTDKVRGNEQVEAQPGTSGMSTRTRARKATDLPDVLVPKRRCQGRPKKTVVKDTAKSVTGVQTPTTSMTPQVTPRRRQTKRQTKCQTKHQVVIRVHLSSWSHVDRCHHLHVRHHHLNLRRVQTPNKGSKLIQE